MIHDARKTGKFIKLVRWLRKELADCPVDHETVAIGILERMWHFTMTSHKRGDIGDSENEVIAEALGWFGEPDDLIAVLVDCEWLDEHPDHRLIVHDWAEHAPRHIKRNASRMGGLLGLSDSDETLSDDKATQESRLVATPNQTKPNQTKEVPPTEVVPSRDADSKPVMEFPVKSSKSGDWPLTESKIDEWVGTYGDRRWVESELRKARQWCMDNPSRQKTPTGMASFLGKWLARANDSGRSKSEPERPRAVTTMQSFRKHRKAAG